MNCQCLELSADPLEIACLQSLTELPKTAQMPRDGGPRILKSRNWIRQRIRYVQEKVVQETENLGGKLVLAFSISFRHHTAS